MNRARRPLARGSNSPFLLWCVISASLVCPILRSAEVPAPKAAEESRAIRWAKQDVENNEKLFGAESEATADALHKLGEEYFKAAQFTNVAPLWERTLRIYEKMSGSEHPNTATSLNNLAALYQSMGDYAKAEPLYQRTLRISEKVSGPEHPDTARSLNNLAALYWLMVDYAKAEPLYQRALRISEKVSGSEHPNTATILNNLAALYVLMGDYAKAEPLLQRALRMREVVSGPEHPDTARSVNNLAALYQSMGDYAKAELLLQRALRISEKVLGPEHLEMVQSLNNLAGLYFSMGDFRKAEPLYQRALRISQNLLGPDHLKMAMSLDNLAALYKSMGDYAKAEALHQRALRIHEKVLGPEHPHTASSLYNLALLYGSMGEYAKAEPLFHRALRIMEEAYGWDHLDTNWRPEALGTLFFLVGKQAEARDIATRSQDASFKKLARVLSFTSESQRLAYQATVKPYDLFGCLGSGPALAESVLRHKGVVLDSLIEDRLVAASSQSPEQRARVEQLRTAKQRLTQLLLEVPRDLSEEAKARRATERETLARQAEQLEAELARHFAGLGRARRALSVTVPEVQTALSRDAVLMEMIRYTHYLGKDQKEARYGAVLIFPSGDPKWVPLGSAEAIDQNIARYHESVRGSATSANASQSSSTPPTPSLSPDGGEGVRRAGEGNFSTVLQALYQKLWAPVQTALPKNVRTIILSPDGELSFVSFATLLTPDQQFLAQKYSLRYVASGRDLLRRFQPPKAKKLSVYANPNFSGKGVLAAAPSTNVLVAMREIELRDFRSVQLPPLVGTAKESAALVARAKTWGWPAESYSANEASEAQLRAVESPYILHLATHGFFLPEEKRKENETELGWRGIGGVRPSSASGLSMESDSLMRPPAFLKNPMHRSGLAVAGAQTTLEAWKHGDVPPTENDGIVTADEVGTLKLDGTWLVVLSACDTGAGEARSGEGVLGLRRGFIQAGAQNLLLTLWTIKDEETAKFMMDFYEAAHASNDAGQALADVQRDWLVKLRKERSVQAAVQLAGPFILSSQGEMK